MVPALKVLRTLGAPWRTAGPPERSKITCSFSTGSKHRISAVTSAA